MFDRLKEKYMMWRKGLVRTVPYPARGRVYRYKDESRSPERRPTGDGFFVTKTGTVELEMKIKRADGTEEVVKVPKKTISKRIKVGDPDG